MLILGFALLFIAAGLAQTTTIGAIAAAAAGAWAIGRADGDAEMALLGWLAILAIAAIVLGLPMPESYL